MTDVSGVEHDANLSRRSILAIVVALMCGALLFALNTSMVGVALPTIAADLHGIDSITWIITSYLLAATAVAPLYGKLSDIYGRKRVYVVSVVLFVAGSILCGLAQSMAQLIAARAMQGAGGGGLLVGAFAILGEVVSPRERGRYLPYIQGITSTGIVLGPALGGLLVDHLSWRWAFFIFVPIGIVTLVIIAATLHLHPHHAAHRIDYVGALLIVMAVCALLLAVTWGGHRHAWTSPTIIGLVALTIVLLGAFVVNERRVAEPVVPLDLFRHQSVRVGALFMFVFTGCTVGATIVVYSQFVQIVLGYAPSDTWVLNLPFAICNVIAGVVIGRRIARTGRYKVFPIVGSCVCFLSLLAFARLNAGSSAIDFCVAAALLGVGMGMSQHVPLIGAQNAVGRDELGTATSTIQFSQQLGTTVGASILGAMFSTGLAERAHRLDRVDVPRDVLGQGRLAIRALPDVAQQLALDIYADSIHHVFLVAMPFAIVAMFLATRIREEKLLTWSYAAQDMDEDDVVHLPASTDRHAGASPDAAGPDVAELAPERAADPDG